MRCTVVGWVLIAVCLSAHAWQPSVVEWTRFEDGGRTAAAALKAEILLLDESFEEESWPGFGWRVTHPAGSADVDWGRTDLRASDGSHSIWCAAGGSQAPGPGGVVPPGSESWAIAGPFRSM